MTDEQNLVKELVGMSTLEQTRAIRELTMSFEEKKNIRWIINGTKALAVVQKWLCQFFRRCSYTMRSARQALELWHGIMKEIGGKFGTSVLTYFLFLKWLLLFNIFSFVVNFSFITVPLLVYGPNITSNVSFRGLELLTGAGYFTHTVMYYGAYSNETLRHGVEYNLQLAYFFTIVVYMVLCGIALTFSMASSFKKNFVLVDPASTSAWQLLCSWDFSLTGEKTVTQRKNNLRESLSEKAQQKLLTLREKLKHSGIHLGSWLVSTALVAGCASSFSLQQEAETLLVPFVVSLMNLVIPLFFSLFNKFEHYSNNRSQIYSQVVRNVLLRMSILGVLCYHWMNEVSQRESFLCWESMVGQALYRLVIVDFLFLMLGSFFGEFLRNVIGTKLHRRLGPPEFDVARNVLDLIYAQTLAWIGLYFSPLLPSIQILKFFILFYLKKVSLTQNCQPPCRTGRAAQMQTIFIFLLFIPFYVGAISIVGYTAWSLNPSQNCGPFRGLDRSFSVVELWMAGLQTLPGSGWAVWIFENIIKSEIFYFLITLIILAITYVFYQLIQGRKMLIDLLKQRIVNEGKDKSFLLDKLQNLQKSRPKKDTKHGRVCYQTFSL
uniref:Transmembrane channel-like protein n=1 Tax=Oryzias latipes TaxID=8090 RepID=H2MDF0_ORYLA